MAIETALQTAQMAAAKEELGARIRRGQLSAADELAAEFPDLWCDTEARLELAYTEYVLRASNGEQPARADWFERYPDLQDRMERLFGLYDLMVLETRQSIDTVHRDRSDLPLARDLRDPVGYEVLEPIGRGGMAVVYRARHRQLNRVVALKVLCAGDWDSSRVRREAELLARLQHPNIVQVYEMGEWNGDPFLALEFVAGGTLADALAVRLKEGQTGFTSSEASELVRVLAIAVQAAHEQGVVHRDLKPANVLLTDDPEGRFACPKITDFGLALSTDPSLSVSQSVAIVGTPGYMAPEQAGGQRSMVGPATDVYALGSILYELLTGRPPFQGATVLETLDLVRHAEPVSPRQLRPRLPRDLATICLKCLDKDPARRYSSARLLAEDLHRFQTGQPIVARPVSGAERAWKWCRRQPVLAGLAGGLAVAIVAAVVLPWFFWRQSEQGKEREAQLRQLAEHGQDRESTLRREAEKGKEREAGLRREAESREASLGLKTARLQWMDHDIMGARESLSACGESYRNEEWAYLWRASRPPICELNNKLLLTEESLRDLTTDVINTMNLQRPGVGVNGAVQMAFSFDGKRVGVLRRDGRVQMYDSKTGALHTSWSAGVYRTIDGFAAADPSTTYLAMRYGGKSPGVVWLYDPHKKENRAIWKVRARAIAFAFSANGQCVACVTETALGIFDLAQNKERWLVENESFGTQPTACVLSADGQRVSVYPVGESGGAVGGKVRVWNTATGAALPAINPPNVPKAKLLAASPDGERAVYESVQINGRMMLHICFSDPSAKTVSFPSGIPFHSMATFSPDGQRLAVNSRDAEIVVVWDATQGREIVQLRGHKERASAVSFSPDGRNLAIGDSGGRIAIWDVTRDDEP